VGKCDRTDCSVTQPKLTHSLTHTSPAPHPHAGLHYLHGPSVQPLQLRGGVIRDRRAVHPARDRGQVHHVWTRPAHALHAGHVQQWNQGVEGFL